MGADEMDAVADLAQACSLNEILVSHEQNLVLPHVKLGEPYLVWQARAGHAEHQSHFGFWREAALALCSARPRTLLDQLTQSR